MTKIGIFPDWAADYLSRPTVIVTLLLRIHFDSGTEGYHAGPGTIVFDGLKYLGVTDPGSKRAVKVDAVEEPRAGVASRVEITLSGVDSGFMKQVRSGAEPMEGKSADLMLGIWDSATKQAVGPAIPFFPFGKLTQPTWKAEASGVRSLMIGLESWFMARNAAVAGTYTGPDQRRRSSGDTACDFVGSTRILRWPV